MEQLFEINPKAMEKPIVIYGAGNTGMDLLVELMNRNIRVEYFCDSNPEKCGIQLMNKTVLSINELTDKKDDYNVIIASIYFEEINTELESRGFKNIFCYKDIWRVRI